MVNEFNNIKTATKLDLNNLECTILSKIDIKDSRYQILELINEKADRIEVEKLKTGKLDVASFEVYKNLIQNSDQFGNF